MRFFILKAMDRSKLVQKDVLVHREGKTFMRRQWVRGFENVETTGAPMESMKEIIKQLTKNHSKAVLMETAREKYDITWTKHDHEGINWMRASMAIQEYLKGGDKFVVSDVPNEPTQREVAKVVKKDKEKPKKEINKPKSMYVSSVVSKIMEDMEKEDREHLNIEELVALNEMMLGRGAPIVEDGVGYNKIDFSNLKDVVNPTLGQASYIARVLVKYSRTQLGMSKDVLTKTKEYFDALRGLKPQVKEENQEKLVPGTGTEETVKVNTEEKIVIDEKGEIAPVRKVYHDISFEDRGGAFIVTGNSYPARKLLFDAGAKWNDGGFRGVWSFAKPKYSEAYVKKQVESIKFTKLSVGYKTSSDGTGWGITGDTYPVKDMLSELGAKWGDGRDGWVFPKGDFSEEDIQKLVEGLKYGDNAETIKESLGHRSGKIEHAVKEDFGFRGSLTRINRRFPLRSVTAGEYGKLVSIRGKVVDAEPKLDTDISEPLRLHQKHGVELAINSVDSYGGFLLTDGTGAGKTMQELALAVHYARKGETVMVVVPNKGIMNQAFRGDAKTLGVENMLVEFSAGDMLQKGKVNMITYHMLNKLKNKPDYIIFDEAHYLKNKTSARAKKGTELAKGAKGVVFATATAADKAEHAHYLDKLGIFKNTSFSGFMRNMGYIYEEKRLYNTTVGNWKRNIDIEQAATNLDTFFTELEDLGMMTKREVSMDKVTVDFNVINLPSAVHEELDRIEAFYGGENPDNRAIVLMAQRRFQEPYKIPYVLKMAKERIEQGKQVVVFATRVNESEIEDVNDIEKDALRSEGTITQLHDEFTKLGIPVSKIYGGGNIDKEVKKFQEGKTQVAIVTPEKGGAGLSLDDTVGNKPRSMIVMTPPFSGVDNVQMSGRINRLNTKSHSDITFVISDTNVDVWNMGIIKEKMKTLSAVVKGSVTKLSKSETMLIISI